MTNRLFCSALIVIHCFNPFSSATPADDAIEEGILLLGNGSEPHSLDPHINSSMNGHHVIVSLIDRWLFFALKAEVNQHSDS